MTRPSCSCSPDLEDMAPARKASKRKRSIAKVDIDPAPKTYAVAPAFHNSLRADDRLVLKQQQEHLEIARMYGEALKDGMLSKSRTSTPPPHSTSSPLMRLPSEIRREILRYLLPNPSREFHLYTDNESSLVRVPWNRHQRGPTDERWLAVLRTNRDIYYEGISVLYSESRFHFIAFNYSPVLDFIRRLGPEARSMVRKVRLSLLPAEDGTKTPNLDRFCMAIHDFFPGLTTLHADPWVWL